MTLRPGVAVPARAVSLAWRLEARGLRLSREGDVLVVRPGGQLSAADRRALLAAKPALLALVSHDAEAVL